jgi:hypothetical protein
MNITDYFAVTSIFSALFIILGWWLKSRLEGSIGHEYAKIIELFKTKNQLRIAALSERLRAHQQAYQLWREINTHLGSAEIHEVILKCDRWWGENCLYLEPEARNAFLTAFVRARDIEVYKNNSSSSSLVTECHKQINDAGAIIESSVALPPLNEFEFSKKA